MFAIAAVKLQEFVQERSLNKWEIEIERDTNQRCLLVRER